MTIIKSIELKVIRFRMQNIRDIFIRKNKWLQSLNYKINVEITPFMSTKDALILILDQTHRNITFYEYPDEDFCYFKDFPHNKLVLPVLKPLSERLSCAFIFLIQYSNYYQNDISNIMVKFKSGGYVDAYYEVQISDYTTFQDMDSMIIYCDKFIEKLIQNCNVSSIKKQENYFHFYVLDWKHIIKLNQYLFSLIILPIFSLITIAVNILTIAILSTKGMDDTKGWKIYPFLKINSYFVILYLFVSFFKIFYVCINDSFKLNVCFTESNSIYARYFYIIVIRLIGNSLKTCSSISYTWFTIRRYITVTDTNNAALKFFDNLKMKYHLLIAVSISLLVNFYSYFQFSTTIHESQMNIRFYSDLDVNKLSVVYSNYYAINDYSQELDTSAYLILNILSIFKILVSDLLFILISLIFDFMLFIFIKQKNNKKYELNEEMPCQARKSKIIKRFKRDRAVKNRISGMIILNGINFFLFKTPSLIMSFYGFIYKYDLNSAKPLSNFYNYYICRTQKLCNLLMDMSYCFYLFSFVIQFFIFYKLDKNFKKYLKDIILRAKTKLLRHLRILN